MQLSLLFTRRFLSIIILLLTWCSLVFAYDFSSPLCSDNNIQQSPININLNETLYTETNFFRILSNDFKPLTPNDIWSYFPNEYAIGVMPHNQNDFGTMLLIKDWAIYNFILKKVLFRIGSDHALDNTIQNAEMQLIFYLDANYYSPGKRIFLDTNYLIVSIPLRVSNDSNQKFSRIFEFMNLKSYANSPTSIQIPMTRNIKLHQFVVHQPAFLYKGTLTFPECQNALWLIMNQYQVITQSDFDNLKTAISANVYLPVERPYNTRQMKSRLADTIVYRNFDDFTKMTSKASLLNYNSADKLTISGLLMLLLVLLF